MPRIPGNGIHALEQGLSVAGPDVIDDIGALSPAASTTETAWGSPSISSAEAGLTCIRS